MMIGAVLRKSAVEVYSPIYRSPGPSASFSVSVTQVVGALANLVIKIEHKNGDEASWQTATLPSITAVGDYALVVTDLREFYRWRYEMGGGTTDWARVTSFDPTPETPGAQAQSPGSIFLPR